MTYQYEPSDTEIEAVKYLEKFGWRISPPSCPLCQGSGTMGPSFEIQEIIQNGKHITRMLSKFELNQPLCTNGCPIPSMYY